MEKVLGFPTSLLKELGDFQGYSTKLDAYLPKLLDCDVLTFMDRDKAEKDPSFKQVIPYVAIRVGGLYLQYERTKKGGEDRLHSRYSIGVGGHINQADGLFSSHDGPDPIVYERGFFRELFEEVGLLFKDCRTAKASIVGMINDDSDPVGQVHFGVVHVVDVPRDHNMTFKDPALAKCSFCSKKKLTEDISRFENWSKLVIQNLPD